MKKDYIIGCKQKYIIKSLFVLANKSEVKNFGKFNNARYLGLYKEIASQIKKCKKLDKNEDMLDYMISTELGANIFRITQMEDILSKGHISAEDKARKTHKEVGQKVRKAIKDIGGTMPEDLPTPKESIKKIEKVFYLIKSYQIIFKCVEKIGLALVGYLHPVPRKLRVKL